jgi:hypothetical protein
LIFSTSVSAADIDEVIMPIADGTWNAMMEQEPNLQNSISAEKNFG